MTSSRANKPNTSADLQLRDCLIQPEKRNFVMVAGVVTKKYTQLIDNINLDTFSEVACTASCTVKSYPQEMRSYISHEKQQKILCTAEKLNQTS